MSFRLVRTCPLAAFHDGQNLCSHRLGEMTNPSAFIWQRGWMEAGHGDVRPGSQPGSRRINCRWAAARPLQIEAARFLPGQAMRVPATSAFEAWEGSETSYRPFQCSSSESNTAPEDHWEICRNVGPLSSERAPTTGLLVMDLGQCPRNRSLCAGHGLDPPQGTRSWF